MKQNKFFRQLPPGMSSPKVVSKMDTFIALANDEYFKELGTMGMMYQQLMEAKRQQKPIRVIREAKTVVPDWFMDNIIDFKEIVVTDMSNMTAELDKLSKEEIYAFFGEPK